MRWEVSVLMRWLAMHRSSSFSWRWRTLAASSDPCDLVHRHIACDELYLDEASIAKVVPTTLVVMMIGNLVTASLFYGLGKAKNTASFIGFIPASVLAGFLTCIGYKVWYISCCSFLLTSALYFSLTRNETPNINSKVIKLAVLITTGFAFKQKYIKVRRCRVCLYVFIWCDLNYHSP